MPAISRRRIRRRKAYCVAIAGAGRLSVNGFGDGKDACRGKVEAPALVIEDTGFVAQCPEDRIVGCSPRSSLKFPEDRIVKNL